MPVLKLWISDFRCFTEVELEPDPEGLTVLLGENGAGKTSILEAIGWIATQRSFRGGARETIVRSGQPRALIRADVDQAGRPLLIEAELPVAGSARMQVNRQPVRRQSDLASMLAVTVFSPEDLTLVQGGPAYRRQLLDDVLMSLHPRNESLMHDVDRALRQRAALLRQAGGRISPEVEATLDIWDSRLAESGTQLADARSSLLHDLRPLVLSAHRSLVEAPAEAAVDAPADIRMTYRRSWSGLLVDALAENRQADLRRQATTSGPHRDELELTISGRNARHQASQGEQRSLALALRLGTHQLLSDRNETPPILLLDDVFSELDPRRTAALVRLLPPGQVLLSTAVGVPEIIRPDRVVKVSDGAILPEPLRGESRPEQPPAEVPVPTEMSGPAEALSGEPHG